MRFRTLILIGMVLAIAASVAYADTTIMMPTAALAEYGWSTTVKADSGGRGSVSNRVQNGVEGIQFTNGDKDRTGGCWSAISTTNYDGIKLSQLTTLTIRTYGLEGDGSLWQAPTFYFALKKAPANLSNRFVMWAPWTNGNSRSTSTWNTYNALTTGQWVCPWTGGVYNSMSALLVAFPDLTIANPTEIASMDSAYKGKGFNVGFANWINGSNTESYSDDCRGTVDYFTVGVDGVNKTWDLGVPEPGSIFALATGLLGLVGLRRRMVK